MRLTTDLEVIQAEPFRFTWGEVITIERIGVYTIVEYYPWQVEGASVHTGEPNRDERSYFGYIDGKSTSQSWESLDAALAGLIARRHEGLNSRAGEYFMKMIGK